MRTGRRASGEKNVDDAAADRELAGEVDHFRAGVADAAEMVDECFVRDFGVFGENLREASDRRRDPGSARERRSSGR